MAAVLSMKYKTAFTKGNLNNHIGVPLSLLAIKSDREIAIIEMGANHQKEIAFLSAISEPDYGYITNYGKAHLEGFGGVEGIIKGKSELYDFLRTKPGSKVFLNLDDPKQIEKSAGIPAISFGHTEQADYVVKLIDDGSPVVKVSFDGMIITSQLTGSYNYSNLAAAICIGRHFEVDTADIKMAIESYAPSNNRSQLSETDRNKLIIDSYNANPSSVEAALHNFSRFGDAQKWVLLGDMFEMGEWSAEEHQRITDLTLELDFERILLAGKDFCATSGDDIRLKKFPTTDDLLDYLKDEKPTGKTILIKGSRGMQMERVIPFL
jgi:UDP-N-acetylmuramoyl-tripeptide--D-alanyl-D-alanine ligase